jgi:hypothetical protein
MPVRDIVMMSALGKWFAPVACLCERKGNTPVRAGADITREARQKS